MKTIKYIGFYPKDRDNFIRSGSIAASNKMDYITGAINSLGYKVKIISPSWFHDNFRNYSKQYTVNDHELKAITFAPSFRANNRMTRRIRALYSQIWLFTYLFFNTKKDENILVYHSLLLIKPVLFAKKLRKFNLILECNEIYSDVKEYSNRIRKMEYRIFELAEKFIFSTELLNHKLNKQFKPFVINYGTYKVENERNQKFDDGRIHAVYAGIIDDEKGAKIAVETSMYLNARYHIHIIGFGSEADLEKMRNLINNITRVTECTITYDGLITGEEYVNFMQKCDIGLSTQTPDASFNDTSFPSKVLSYLSNGLRVVSIRINAIEKSKVSGLLYFYDTNSPMEIADTIKKIDLQSEYNSRTFISNLNDFFINDIGELIHE